MTATLYLPALQGQMGDWLYYACLMRLEDLSERVGYAHEIHQNKKLSERIQRQLEDRASKRLDRVSDISRYLRENEDRFFNALVVGVYGGQPQWHPFEVRARDEQAFDATALAEADRDTIGFLELTGAERLFALDGQHRLAGIKDALQDKPELAEERVTVLFVSHASTEAGLRRTRSLFISLNKKAAPVARKDIIMLDEVDLPAIITRSLADDHPWFSQGQVDIDRFTQNLPAGSSAITTLGGLYDLIQVAVPRIMAPEAREELKIGSRVRLPEDRVAHFRDLAIDYFQFLASLDPELQGYFDGKGDPAVLAPGARTPENPRTLFRPVGQMVVTKALAELRRSRTRDQLFALGAQVPKVMSAAPFEGLIWDSGRGKVNTKGAALSARLLVYMLGGAVKVEDLRRKYAAFLDRPLDEVELPQPLV